MSTQMERFGAALLAYSEGRAPDDYASEYTKALALDIARTVPPGCAAWMWAVWGAHRAMAEQKADLAAFGCRFDTWSLESDLHSGATSFLRRDAALGRVYQDGRKDGEYVCLNCASPVVPNVPCAFCKEHGFYQGEAQ